VKVHWFAVFDQALRSADVIAVWAAVENHLERPLTTTELAAARRAANRYAAASTISVVRIPAPVGGRIRTIPLLARADADLSDIERLTAIASGRIAGTARRGRVRTSAAVRTQALVASVGQASRQARSLRPGRFDPSYAAQLAAELAEALPRLQELEERLRQRGQSPTPATDGAGRPVRRKRSGRRPSADRRGDTDLSDDTEPSHDTERTDAPADLTRTDPEAAVSPHKPTNATHTDREAAVSPHNPTNASPTAPEAAVSPHNPTNASPTAPEAAVSPHKPTNASPTAPDDAVSPHMPTDDSGPTS
jgi:hypothetical protein